MTSSNRTPLEGLISKTFPDEIQQKKILEEIQKLRELNPKLFKVSLQGCNQGLKIIVEIMKELITQELCDVVNPNEVIPIVFEMILEPKFPFVFPRVTCRTRFTNPSLADGRDYLLNILQKIWNPSIFLSQIVTLISDFLKRIYKDKDNIVALQKLGVYHLGLAYNLDDLFTLDGVAVFPCQEILVKSTKDATRCLVVTDTSLLNFEPIPKLRNIAKLVSWAPLQSLITIKRKYEDESAVILTWKDNSRKDGVTQIFLLEDVPKFIEIISENINNIASRLREAKLRLSERSFDVSLSRPGLEIDINQILQNIAIAESHLKTEVTVDNINALTSFYQRAIQYYSTKEDKHDEYFIKKLELLLSREDVRKILNGDQDEEEKKEIRGNTNRENSRDQPPKPSSNSKFDSEEKAMLKDQELGNEPKINPFVGKEEPRDDTSKDSNEPSASQSDMNEENTQPAPERDSQKLERIKRPMEPVVESDKESARESDIEAQSHP